MTDDFFIERILQKGKEAKDKVKLEFSNITSEQLNWKFSAESWNIAQCLDHLVSSHNVYFPAFKKITEGNYKMNFWERYSPFSHICGRIMKDRLQEQVKKKMIAPKIIQPSASKMNIEIIEDYYKSLDRFLAYISNCRNIDIDKIIINSPTIAIVTYSLRDAFQFLVQHEHRHINQAIRVKLNENFPSARGLA
jgi:uncharacterized damage-inducible protein DinB